MISGDNNSWEGLAFKPKTPQLGQLVKDLLDSAGEEAPADLPAELLNCWKRLSGDSTLETLRLRYPSKGRDDSNDDDKVDPVRLHRRLSGYLAAGVAAYWMIRRHLHPEAAEAQLPAWLERVGGLKPGTLTFAVREWLWKPARLLDAFAAQTPLAAEAVEVIRSLRPEFADGPPVASLKLTLAGIDHQGGKGNPFQTTLDVLGGLGGLREHGAMWNLRLGEQFVATVRESYEAAWPDPKTRPAVRWRVDPAAGSAPTPLRGRSLGLALHVGMLALSRGLELDQDVVLSAAVRGGALESVGGLRGKAQALLEGGFRRFVVWAKDVGPSAGLSESDSENFRARGLQIVRVSSVEEALQAATMHPTLSRYLDWVHERHQRLQVAGVDRRVSRSEAPLDEVYVALRGIDTSPSEMNAAVRVARRNYDREHSTGDPASRLHATEEIHEWMMRIAPIARQFREADRRDAEPGGPKPRVMNLAEAFKENPVLVILGDPGGGKTTLLRWLARHAARSVPEGRFVVLKRQVDPTTPEDDSEFPLGPACVPILIRASQILDKIPGREVTTLWDVLGRPRWDKKSPYDPAEGDHALIPDERLAAVLHEAIDEQRALILIDGLDEVIEPRDRVKVSEAIRDFIVRHVLRPGESPTGRRNLVVVTSRIIGYHMEPIDPRVAPRVFTIRPMEQAAIKHFCRVWYRAVDGGSVEDSAGLIAALYDPEAPTRAELAGNPLLLTVMAIAYSRPPRRLPPRRPALFRLTIGYLIDIWQRDDEAIGRVTDAETTWKMLGAVAREIHERYPSNIITEEKAAEVLRKVLKAKEPREVDDLIERFFTNARDTAGLFVEVTPQFWRFLHPNYQEYLAARHLLDDSGSATRLLLERANKPRWRVPLLLALGIASEGGESERAAFDDLLKSLLGANDALDPVLPRATLLLVDALKDIEEVPGWLWERLADRLMATYADRTGIGRFRPLQDCLEDAFATLGRQWKIPRQHGLDGDGLDVYLISQIRNSARASAVARLVASQGWFRHDLVKELFNERWHDGESEGWVIDRMLQALAIRSAAREAPANGAGSPRPGEADLPPQLEFRRRFLGITIRGGLDVVSFLEDHPTWLRLIAALFGGFGDLETPRRLREYYALSRVVQFGGAMVPPDEAREMFPEDDLHPLRQIAKYLDAKGKECMEAWDSVPEFRSEYLYRDTESAELSALISSALEDAVRDPSRQGEFIDQIIGRLRATWDDPSAPGKERSEAMVGLIALGPRLVADWGRLAEKARRIPEILDELRRVRASLSDPIIRAAKRVTRAVDWVSSRLPPESVIHVVGGISDLASRHGSVPYLTMVSGSSGFCQPKVRAFLLAEAWAFWLSGAGSDIRYDVAVVLDTLGQRFQEDPMLLILAASALPSSSNLRWPDHLGWPIEMVPPRTDEPLDQTITALDAVAAMPDEIEFVRDWALKNVLRKYLDDNYPELVPEWEMILLSYPYSNSFEYDASSWPVVGDFRAWLDEKSQKITDNYLKARYLARGIVLDPDRRAHLAAEAMKAARKVPQGSLQRALIMERLIPLIDDDRPAVIREALRAAKRLDSDNKARAFARLARYTTGFRRFTMLFRSAFWIRTVTNEAQKSETLGLLRREWKIYDRTDCASRRVAATFWDGYYRAHAAGLLTPIFERFRDRTVPAVDRAVAEAAWPDEDKKAVRDRLAQAVDTRDWGVLELGGIIEDALKDADDQATTGFLWMALSRGEGSAFEALRDASARDELPLTRAAAVALDALIAKGWISRYDGVLSLVRDPDPALIPQVDGWSRHADGTVRRHAALLLAEAGLIREDTVPELVACLLDPVDRVRYRASKVCYYPRNGRHTRGLTAEVMEAIAREIVRHRSSAPAVSLALKWLWGYTNHNDREAVRRWVREAEAGEDRKSAIAILRSMLIATPDVWAVIVESIEAPGPARDALLIALAGMLERTGFSPDREAEVGPKLLRIAEEGPEPSRVLAIRALGHFAFDPRASHRLEALAARVETSPTVRSAATLALGRLAMTRIDLALNPPVADRTIPPRKPTRDEIRDLAREIEDQIARLGDRWPAEFLASVYLAWRSHPFGEELDVSLPATARELARQVGDPRQALRAIFETERYTHTWGHLARRMVSAAADFVNEHSDQLIGPLVVDLARELDGPLSDWNDSRLMNLLTVTARVSISWPNHFADAAWDHPALADRLADAAVKCGTFPGRASAVFLLGMLDRPLNSDHIDTLVRSLHDVCEVQKAALEAFERLREISDDVRRKLYEFLSGPSAVAAYAASRVLVHIGTDPGTSDLIYQEILEALATASIQPGADRFAMRLDENTHTERWSIHHLGRLRDVFHRAMMTMTGLS